MKAKSKRKHTIGKFIGLALTISIFACGCNGKQSAPKTESRQEETKDSEAENENTAPDFTAEVNDGSSFLLSEQSGKVVLLNFWATWCGPCVAEMPAFERLYQDYDKEDVAILAINCMEEKSTVDQFVADSEYTFPIAYDEAGEISQKYPTNGIPYTLIIGKDGSVKKTYIGARDAETQYQEYKKAVDAALKEE